MKICPKCGKENSNNSKYCEKCGEALMGKRETENTTAKVPIIIIGVLSAVLISGGVILLTREPYPTSDGFPIGTTESEPESEPEPEPKLDPESESEAEPAYVEYTLPTSVPDEYFYLNGHTYAFYDADEYNLSSYEQVSDFCHEQGGHLAVMNDSAENRFLYDLAIRKFRKTVFFGYTDENEEGYWEWDGEGSGYENWSRSGDWNLPDNGAGWGGGEWIEGGEDYAEFNYDENPEWGQPNDSTWNDAKFMENTTVFACEWDYDMRNAIQ